MEQALSARTLLALGLALAPELALAKPAPAGPDSAATAALIKQCGDTEDFSAPAPPARLYGNTYYVGTCTVSVLLVTSPQGHILVDTATAKAVPSILANIRALGFRPEDVRWIVTSHEHFDHVGGLAGLVRATGAKVALSAAAAAVVATGKVDPADSQYGVLKDHDFAPVLADRIVRAGSVVRAGPLPCLLWLLRALPAPSRCLLLRLPRPPWLRLLACPPALSLGCVSPRPPVFSLVAALSLRLLCLVGAPRPAAVPAFCPLLVARLPCSPPAVVSRPRPRGFLSPPRLRGPREGFNMGGPPTFGWGVSPGGVRVVRPPPTWGGV